jgi:hypothetical protein
MSGGDSNDGAEVKDTDIDEQADEAEQLRQA